MIQNRIALIWDFDKTLIDNYMQTPIFNKYSIDQDTFWKEVDCEVDKIRQQGIRVNRDMYYLNHFLNYVKDGRLKGLNNKELRELGGELKFCEGVLELLNDLKVFLEKHEKYSRYDIKVEYYIISTGLAEMIKGSEIAKYIKDIWGCEFIEEKIEEGKQGEITQISQIAYAIDNTSKTKAIFEINKGSNLHAEIDVNAKLAHQYRRIPIKNMVYVADGPSDIPVFSVIKKNGGKTFAVYRKGNKEEFRQVDQLRKDNRVDMYGEANYSKETLTYMWLRSAVEEIADNIYEAYEAEIKSSSSPVPKHI